MKKIVYIILLATQFSYNAYSQCAMCKATVETHVNSGESKADGLNLAILYLLIIPYACAGIFWYLWKTNKRKNAEHNKRLQDRILAVEK